jgi:uncharacterized protein (TIGR00730 family)
MASKKKNDDHSWVRPAYNNPEFLNSPAARTIRVMSEMVEPADRFRKHRVWNTVVFFGSARTQSGRETRKRIRDLEAKASRHKSVNSRLARELDEARRDARMSHYYDDAVALAEKLTRWFLEIEEKGNHFMVCTGGGPGIMEAANRGAKKAGGKSVGLNISLPFEQAPNRFQTRELALEFHYFFIRKFWFFYPAKALVVFPGGFGTLDEFFELLTIIQTEKSKKYMPVILYGSEYWNSVLNVQEMVRWGTISPHDLTLYRQIDTVDEAFEYLKGELAAHYVINGAARTYGHEQVTIDKAGSTTRTRARHPKAGK